MTPMLTDDTGGTGYVEGFWLVNVSDFRVVSVPILTTTVNVFPPTPHAAGIAINGDTSGPGEASPHSQLPQHRRRF